MNDFRSLHDSFFVMPNAWDVGSAVRLADLGFPALATTSSGHAWSLGKQDQEGTREDLVTYVAALAAAVELPLNVDAERCFPDDPGGVAETVRLVADAGAAGISVEDYDPASASIEDLDTAVERVALAAEAARASGLVLTARAEQHLYGEPDLSDTIARLVAYRDAGADVLYAPGLTRSGDIARVVREVGVPVNVLLMPDAPGPAELAELGVARASTGGALAKRAYAAAVDAAEELLS